MNQLSITNRTGSRSQASLYQLPAKETVPSESTMPPSQLLLAEGGKADSADLKIFTVDQIRSLREEKKNYSRLQLNLDTLPVAALIVDERGRIEFANMEFGRILAYGLAEINGSRYSELVQDRQIISVSNEGEQTKTRLLAKARKQDGTEFPVEISETMLETCGKRKTIAVFQDRSSYDEQARNNHNFVAMVTHELKTPLTCVNGILSLLEEGVLGDLNDQGRVMTQQVRGTCKRLVRLINDLLDLEKIQAGKLLLECKKVNVATVARQAIESVMPIAGARKFQIDAEPDLLCFADEDRLVQVLVNLLSNSIKFSGDKSKIRIIADTPEGEEMLRISVKDEGRGIPEDKIEKVFECFEQVDILDAKMKGGSGLGLSICKAIVEAHGGQIGVDRTSKKGCRIWFTVPKS